MIAAIYARKSNAQDAVADEAKSVTRQVEHAKAYATRKGWAVDDEFVFVDDGISGVEFDNRPGLMRLMNVLKPRPPFQALVMSEESRLGREMVDTMSTLKELLMAGVRVFCYLDDKELTLDTPDEKALMAFKAVSAESERRHGRKRVVDSMTRNAKLGHANGGRCFGYRNKDVFAGVDADGRPRRSHVEREVNEAEAAVVRRIFAESAAGRGFDGIAKLLNAEGAVAPRPKQGRPAGWCGSSVREVLLRPQYRGEVIWNRTSWHDKWDRKKFATRPEDEWVRVPAPHLRIVSDALWNAAQQRLAATRATYLRSTKGKFWGRPVTSTVTGMEGKYLLSGLLKCGACGANLLVNRHSYGAKREPFYVCSSYHRKGAAVCGNGLKAPLKNTEREILDLIEADVLADEVVEPAIAEVLRP
jgi:site-specific DNA recombinase